MEAVAGFMGPGLVTISHSNFDTPKEAPPSAKVTDAGGNQAAPPLFVKLVRMSHRANIGLRGVPCHRQAVDGTATMRERSGRDGGELHA